MKRIIYVTFAVVMLLLASCGSSGYEPNESNPISSSGNDSPNQPNPPAGSGGGNASQNNTALNNEGIFIPSGPGNPPDGILEQLSWYGGGGGLTARACGECQVYVDGNSLVAINFKPFQKLTLVIYRNITGLNFCGYGTSEFVTIAYVQVDENGSLTMPVTGMVDDHIYINTVIDTDTGFVEIPGSTKLEPACVSATQTANAKLPPAGEAPDDTNKSMLCSRVTVNVNDTSSGDILHLQCSNWVYDTPPLAKGVYAVDPDNLFVVYCSFTGDLYVVKVGDPSLVFIENLSARMPAFVAGDVQLRISFSKEDIHHYVTVQDLNSGQEATIKIPLSASQ